MSTTVKGPPVHLWIDGFKINQFFTNQGYTVLERVRTNRKLEVTLEEDLTPAQKDALRTAIQDAMRKVTFL